MIISRFIHVAGNGIISFTFMTIAIKTIQTLFIAIKTIQTLFLAIETIQNEEEKKDKK